MRNKFYSIEKDTLIKLFGEDFKNKFNIVNIEVRKVYDSTRKKDMIADMMDDSKKDDDTKTSGPVIKK